MNSSTTLVVRRDHLDYEMLMNDGKTLMSDLQARVNNEPDNDDMEVPF